MKTMYFDSLRHGLMPVKVVAIEAPAAPHLMPRVVFKLRRSIGAYRAGEIMTVPRLAIVYKLGGARVVTVPLADLEKSIEVK